MKQSLVLALAVVVAATLLVSRAEAARWRIDAEGGAIVPTTDLQLTSGGPGESLDAGGAFSVGGGFGVGDWVDLTAQFQSGFMDVSNFDAFLDLFSFTTGLRAYLTPPGLVRPWLIGQIGWYGADASFHSYYGYDHDHGYDHEHHHETDNSFGFNAGGGIDFSINRRVSLGLDVRYHNAFDAFNGLEFVTTMIDVGIHFGP